MDNVKYTPERFNPHQNLFNTLIDVANFVALETDIAEILTAIEKDRVEHLKINPPSENKHKWVNNKCTKCGLKRLRYWDTINRKEPRRFWVYDHDTNPHFSHWSLMWSQICADIVSAEDFINHHFPGIKNEVMYPAIVAIAEGYYKHKKKQDQQSHKWKDNKCIKCGVERKMQEFTKFKSSKIHRQYVYSDGVSPLKHSKPLCEPKL